jgi:hypothetical protein
MRAILLTLTTCLLALPAHAKYSGGTGEPNDPYLIITAEQMNTIGTEPNDWGKHFKLMADIDLSGYDGKDGRPTFNIIGDCYPIYIPSGYELSFNLGLGGTPFTGVFEGNCHTISHLRVNVQSRFAGLFDGLGYGGQVRNLGIVDVNVTSSFFLPPDLEERDPYYEDPLWSYSCPAGGLVGYNEHGTLTNCYSAGAVHGIGSEAGGVVGFNMHGTVTQCYSTATVSGAAWGIGGLVGFKSGGIVIQCYSAGAVSGEGCIGGLVGYSPGEEPVIASFWDTQTSGQVKSAGGMGKTTAEMQTAKMFLDARWDFVGETDNGTEDIWKIAEGLGYPRLSWEKYSGGTGEPNDPYQIATAADLIALGEEPNDYDKHFILTADIDLDPNLPGRKVFDRAVIGPTPSWNGGTPFNGVFDGNGHTISHLTINGKDYLGLFGGLEMGKIRDVGLVGVEVTGSGYRVGGLVGHTDFGRVTQCYSSGAVSGEDEVGGLVGGTYHSEISNCYSVASVSGCNGVGGLVGSGYEGESNWLIPWGLSHCYSAGSVVGENEVGGLLGHFDTAEGWLPIFDGLWDIEISGQATSAAGTGKTTGEMHTASTFLDAGWDFVGETANGTEDIWWILEGKDYPRLWWEKEAE